MAGLTITGFFILVIIVLFCVLGVKSGFVKSIFDLFAFIFTGLVTWLLYPWFSGVLLNTPLYDSVRSFLMATLKGNEMLEKSLAEFFIETPVFIKDSIIESSKQAFDSLVETTVDALAVLLVNIISIIVLFIIVRIIAFILKKYAIKINDIFFIGAVNKILGGVFGAIQGYFIVCLILFIISLFPAGTVYDRVKKDFEVSYTANVIFSENSDLLGVRRRFIKGD